MNSGLLHPWDVDLKQAREIQNRLKNHIQVKPFRKERFIVAGIDISVQQRENISNTAIVLLSFPELQIIEKVCLKASVTFPYIPGFLSFREVPAILEAWKMLKTEPDLVICDGQGIAHPRHFGLACHAGVLLDKPAFGCAKSFLYGRMEEPPPEKGTYTYISDPRDNSVLGAVVRTKSKVKPVYISIGNLIELDDALRLTLAMAGKYRIPEPTRQAHLYSKKGWVKDCE